MSTRLCTRIKRIQAEVASVDGLRFMVPLKLVARLLPYSMHLHQS
ncbi:hypothetical protein BF49_3999 [Bradyrhizobium sp.]|nr:hypothetical protein BF49_3999 [Bradyrhizobium sp.]